MEIRNTETPSRELLLLADEVEASVAAYIGRGTCYAACDDGRIVGLYVQIHARPFTAEVVNIAVVPGRRSDSSLYDYNLATNDSGDSFDQKSSNGIIDIYGLPSRVAAARDVKVGNGIEAPENTVE